MSCIRCKSERLVHIAAKCSDCCHTEINSKELDDYVVSDIGIGGGDYVELSYCLECGQIQGTFPIEKHVLEEE